MIIMSCHSMRSFLAWSIDFPGCWGENARQDTKPPGPLQQRAVWGKTRLHLPTLGNSTSIPSERHMRWGWLHLPTLGNRTSIPSERHMRSKDVMRTRVPQGENSGITEVPQGTIVGSHMEAILYKDTLFLSIGRIDVNHGTNEGPQMCIVIVDSMLICMITARDH